MACEMLMSDLDAYVDGELPEGELRAFESHLRSCFSCTATAVSKLQMKRAVQTAGRRYTAGYELRRRIQDSIAVKPQATSRFGWAFQMAGLAVIAASILLYLGLRPQPGAVYSEIADLHVAALAGSNPVDVVSSDRHTVKPWFQGKIPFTFDLPELQNSEFSLLGGRVTYLEQTPGAELIYRVRKHQISVFVFPEAPLHSSLRLNSALTRTMSFHLETWSQGGLRYFVIGDAGAADVDALAELFKKAGA